VLCCAAGLRRHDLADKGWPKQPESTAGADLTPEQAKALSGDRAGTFAMTVTVNWRLTFCWDGTDVTDIDYEDYH
jgi:hypothetical protein